MLKEISDYFERILKNPRRLSMILVLGAFLVRFAYVVTLENKWYFYDTVHYDKAARSILAGEGFGAGYYFSSLEAYQDEYSLPPVYPVFLAGVYSIFGRNFVIVRIVQSLIGALICLVVYLIGKQVFNDRVGLTAALVTAFYPLLVFISGLLYVTVLFTLFLALSIWFTLKISDGGTWYAVLAGLFLGLATLAGPILFVMYPFVGLWLIFILLQPLSQRIKAAAVLFAVAIATLIPWSVRNYQVFGRLTPVSAAVDWFLAEAQSKIQNELNVQIRSDAHGYHFDVYVNGEFDGTLSDSNKVQGENGPRFAGVVFNSQVSSSIERFAVKTKPEVANDGAPDNEIIDEFEREKLGANWSAPPDFKTVQGKLELHSADEGGPFLAVFSGVADPLEVSVKWGYTTEASGMGGTGLALMLDGADLQANGYMLKRQPFGVLELWIIELGQPTRLLSKVTGKKTPEPETGPEANSGTSPGFIGKVWHLVTDDPGAFFSHYVFEFVHFWQLYPDRVATKNDFTNWKTKFVSTVTFGPILILALLGVVCGFSRWRQASLLLFTILAFALGYSFFQTRVRYRIPVEPYIIIFAAYGFFVAWGWTKNWLNDILGKHAN